MSPIELMIERRHIFETRLAILEADPIPTAAQNNLAGEEADQHISELKAQKKREAISGLLDLRDAL